MTEAINPVSTVRGSREWAEVKAQIARAWADQIAMGIGPLIERYRELCEVEAWRVMLPDEPRTKERFCQEILGQSAEWLDLMAQAADL